MGDRACESESQISVSDARARYGRASTTLKEELRAYERRLRGVRMDSAWSVRTSTAHEGTNWLPRTWPISYIRW